jgi:hypothetical protein
MKITKKQLQRIIAEEIQQLEEKKKKGKKKGFWDNMWARRRAGKPPKKPGEEGYPSDETYKELTEFRDNPNFPLSEEMGRDLGYGEGEGRHTRAQLFQVAEYAADLHEMLRDDDDLPEWVQTKIATMTKDIDKIKHYLEYKIMRMEGYGEDY